MFRKLLYSLYYLWLKYKNFWDRRFESHWRHWCSSLMSVVCCVCSGLCDELILVQRSFTGCVCLTTCDVETSTMRRSKPGLGCSAGVRIPAGAKDFSLLRKVQTVSGCPPNFLFNGCLGSFTGMNRLGHEGGHSPPSDAEVKSCNSSPICLHGVYKDGFTFNL
jgi:hypothetical protein